MLCRSLMWFKVVSFTDECPIGTILLRYGSEARAIAIFTAGCSGFRRWEQVTDAPNFRAAASYEDGNTLDICWTVRRCEPCLEISKARATERRRRQNNCARNAQIGTFARGSHNSQFAIFDAYSNSADDRSQNAHNFQFLQPPGQRPWQQTSRYCCSVVEEDCIISRWIAELESRDLCGQTVTHWRF